MKQSDKIERINRRSLSNQQAIKKIKAFVEEEIDSFREEFKNSYYTQLRTLESKLREQIQDQDLKKRKIFELQKAILKMELQLGQVKHLKPFLQELLDNNAINKKYIDRAKELLNTEPDSTLAGILDSFEPTSLRVK
jgi:hypothetical protein